MIFLIIPIVIAFTGLLAKRFGVTFFYTYHPLLALLGVVYLGYQSKKLNNQSPEKSNLRKGTLLIAFLTLFSGLGAQMNLTSVSLHHLFMILFLCIAILTTFNKNPPDSPK